MPIHVSDVSLVLVQFQYTLVQQAQRTKNETYLMKFAMRNKFNGNNGIIGILAFIFHPPN
jgi:hypothetical protein